MQAGDVEIRGAVDKDGEWMGWGRAEGMNGHQLKGADDKAEAELDVELLGCHPITLEVEAEGSEIQGYPQLQGV